MSIILLSLMFVFSILFILFSLFIYEKKGIKIIYIIYNIMSFLLSFKIIELLKININANVFILTIFMILTYIIIEKSTLKEMKKVFKQTFYINVIISLTLLLSSLFLGTIADTNTINMKYLFLTNYKILICYPIVTLVIQLLSSLIYTSFKSILKKMSTRILFTSLTILMIDSMLFSIFGYIFEIQIQEMTTLVVTNYLTKVIITIIYLPIMCKIMNLKKVDL